MLYESRWRTYNKFSILNHCFVWQSESNDSKTTPIEKAAGHEISSNQLQIDYGTTLKIRLLITTNYPTITDKCKFLVKFLWFWRDARSNLFLMTPSLYNRTVDFRSVFHGSSLAIAISTAKFCLLHFICRLSNSISGINLTSSWAVNWKITKIPKRQRWKNWQRAQNFSTLH